MVWGIRMVKYMGAKRFLVAGIYLLAACSTGTSNTIDVVDGSTTQNPVKTFSHDIHLGKDMSKSKDNLAAYKDGLQCRNCHEVDLQAGYRPIRPGTQEHSPCNDCHATEYDKPPGEFCKTCHESINPFEKGKSPLHQYPSKYKKVALVSRFNHAQHVAAATRQESGAGLVCRDCHQIKENSAFVGFPVHGNCFSCHETAVAPRMNDCEGCHEKDGFGRNRKFLCNDIRFTHAKHQMTADGEKIECDFCHVGIDESTDSEDLNLPQMYDCASCHDRSEKTPDRVRIDNCGLCHQDTVDAEELPSSHTGESRSSRAEARCL